jgi:hypothetical protein
MSGASVLLPLIQFLTFVVFLAVRYVPLFVDQKVVVVLLVPEGGDASAGARAVLVSVLAIPSVPLDVPLVVLVGVAVPAVVFLFRMPGMLALPVRPVRLSVVGSPACGCLVMAVQGGPELAGVVGLPACEWLVKVVSQGVPALDACVSNTPLMSWPVHASVFVLELAGPALLMTSSPRTFAVVVAVYAWDMTVVVDVHA